MAKFATEKGLHKIIRDIPAAANVNTSLALGLITLYDALFMIAEIIKEEMEREKEAN